MSIKYAITRLMEKITGRKCSRCRWNYKGRCYHPESPMFMSCWNSVSRPGYEDRGEPAKKDLTHEEKHQLEKIKAELVRAEDAARESGLLEE